MQNLTPSEAITHAEDLLARPEATSQELTRARRLLLDSGYSAGHTDEVARLLRELAIARAHADRREGLSSIGRPLGKRKRTFGYLKNWPMPPDGAA